MTLNSHYAFSYITLMFLGVHHKMAITQSLLLIFTQNFAKREKTDVPETELPSNFTYVTIEDGGRPISENI